MASKAANLTVDASINHKAESSLGPRKLGYFSRSKGLRLKTSTSFSTSESFLVQRIAQVYKTEDAHNGLAYDSFWAY